MTNNHLRGEWDQWRKRLAVLQQENILLKNRLAEVMRYDIDLSVLEHAEVYQTIFLNKDAVLALLRHEIRQMEQPEPDLKDARRARSRQEKFRRDVENMEREFLRLKEDFDLYIHHITQL